MDPVSVSTKGCVSTGECYVRECVWCQWVWVSDFGVVLLVWMVGGVLTCVCRFVRTGGG